MSSEKKSDPLLPGVPEVGAIGHALFLMSEVPLYTTVPAVGAIGQRLVLYCRTTSASTAPRNWSRSLRSANVRITMRSKHSDHY